MSKKFKTIESWASSIGYIVERTESDFVWYKEQTMEFRRCQTAHEVLDAILAEIRDSLEAVQ